jgi:uncharacterized phage-like protein YoqJ
MVLHVIKDRLCKAILGLIKEVLFFLAICKDVIFFIAFNERVATLKRKHPTLAKILRASQDMGVRLSTLDYDS